MELTQNNLQAQVDYVPPAVPVTVKTMLQGQPWAQYPTPNCGHTDNG